MLLVGVCALVAGGGKQASAYSWCFAQTDAGVAWYSENYVYDFGANGGVMRCSDGGWRSAPGATVSTSSSGSVGNMLSWQSNGAAYTSLMVSESPDFLTMAYRQDNIVGTSVTVPNLRPGVVYYWRMYGTLASGMKTPYSPTFTFRAGTSGSGTVSSSPRWVDADGDLISPSSIDVKFMDGNGNEIFPKASWDTFGRDD